MSNNNNNNSLTNNSMIIDWAGIEEKWRSVWNEAKLFEADPNQRQKKFITVAYPYPNSPQHVGHGRTYTLADIHARFYRMKGYNVLFPMAFHYTGTPILGMARKVAEGDVTIIDNLENLYGVPRDVIDQFAEPIKIADYFHEEIKAGMIEMGYSIDWRREFTTIDPVYSKFIRWQINTLRAKNLVIQGSHPVGWCPKDQNPVSQHDTLGDVEPDFTEYTLVKFTLDQYVIPTATLRPETIFGVVNLWVNPDVTYKKITVNDNEKWIVSAECAYKMEFHDKKISYDGEISGAELVGRYVITPHSDESIPILPAEFVQSNTGTGIVMSVPAHAPVDYQALVDLKSSDTWAKTVSLIEPKSIIHVDGYGEMPGVEVTHRMKIKDQNDPKIDDATKEVYSAEFYGGKMRSNAGKFAGMAVEYVKDPVRNWLKERKISDIMLELTNTPVRCRCGTECVVKILNNQWFLNYGDKEWKKTAIECFEIMNILPQEIRSEFNNVIDWLRERACARQHGMGTKLPWDDGWIVESLSDSVIYMAYYIVAKFVNDGRIHPAGLSDEFFDYIFLGKGVVYTISESSGISVDTIDEIRSEFLYFYPVDSRHSGRDLVPNHLTFFVMNHIAIFPDMHWPRQIVVNGSVLMHGSKMSKSMGNIIPLRKAIKEYGADPIRLAIVISSELLQDADFNMDSISGLQSKLGSFYRTCDLLKPKDQTDDVMNAEDRWIIAKLQDMIRHVTESMEKMRVREALHKILFEFESDIGWYVKRTTAKNRHNNNNNSGVQYKIHSTRVAMLSPFAPYAAEEMWARLGHSGLVSQSEWPKLVPGDVDSVAIQSEDLLRSTMNDIAKILKVTKITPKRITIYTASNLKFTVYGAILEMILNGQTSMGAIMKGLLADTEFAKIKRDPGFVQKTIKDILSEPVQIREARRAGCDGFDEKQFLTSELTQLASMEFDTQIVVFCEEDATIYDPKGKAKHSRPFKPAILID